MMTGLEYIAELLETRDGRGRTVTIAPRALVVSSERNGEPQTDTYPHDGTAEGVSRALSGAWAGEPTEESRGRLARDAERVRAMRTANRW